MTTIASILRQLEQLVRPLDDQLSIEQFLARNQQLAELAKKLYWPPPWHLPTRTIDRITNAYAQGKLSDEDVERVFLGLYTPKGLNRTADQWENYHWLTPRLPILREGLTNHIEGRYFSAVCTLLPQIEGVHGDKLRRKPNPQNDAEALF